MGLWKKSWVPSVIVASFFGVVYFAMRLYNLTILPIFTDEAIYIRWSQIGSRDASWRYISLVDGKQPLFTWIMMVVLKLIKDPLTAGRLVSVGAGFLSIVGIWFLTFEMFRSKRISFIASLVYLLSPFTLMYDRLALYDSLVAAFSIWNLYIAILLVRKPRLDTALILGMTLGAGMLNKSSGFLSLYMVPGTLLLFDWSKKLRTKRFFKWLALSIVAAVISQMMYSVLRLSPLYAMIGLKDQVFVYSLKDWLTHPFHFFQGNMHGLLDWFIHYLTWPVFLVSFVPILFFWKKPLEKLLLFGWTAAPMVALALFGKVLYPRFVLFMAMPTLVLAADGVWEIVSRIHLKVIVIIVGIILFFQCVTVDYAILTNPINAAIPKADQGQLIDDWPSGWGVREVNAYITTQAKNSKVSVYTDGTFGLMPYAIEMYQLDDKNVKVKGMYPMPPQIPDYVALDAQDHPTFVVFDQVQIVPAWPMTFIAEYQKGNNPSVKMRLYRIEVTTKKK